MKTTWLRTSQFCLSQFESKNWTHSWDLKIFTNGLDRWKGRIWMRIRVDTWSRLHSKDRLVITSQKFLKFYSPKSHSRIKGIFQGKNPWRKMRIEILRIGEWNLVRSARLGMCCFRRLDLGLRSPRVARPRRKFWITPTPIKMSLIFRQGWPQVPSQFRIKSIGFIRSQWTKTTNVSQCRFSSSLLKFSWMDPKRCLGKSMSRTRFQKPIICWMRSTSWKFVRSILKLTQPLRRTPAQISESWCDMKFWKAGKVISNPVHRRQHKPAKPHPRLFKKTRRSLISKIQHRTPFLKLFPSPKIQTIFWSKSKTLLLTKRNACTLCSSWERTTTSWLFGWRTSSRNWMRSSTRGSRRTDKR